MKTHDFKYNGKDRFGKKLFICDGCDAVFVEDEKDYINLLTQNGCSEWGVMDRGMVVEVFYGFKGDWVATSYASSKKGILEQASMAQDRLELAAKIRMVGSDSEEEIDFTLDN